MVHCNSGCHRELSFNHSPPPQLDTQTLHPYSQVIKVYVSIYSDNMGKQTAMSNLKRLEPYVRREMGQRVRGSGCEQMWEVWT